MTFLSKAPTLLTYFKYTHVHLNRRGIKFQFSSKTVKNSEVRVSIQQGEYFYNCSIVQTQQWMKTNWNR